MKQGKRILVIDDDDAIRALLATVLRRRGYIADLARNGEEGLERIAATRYALVVLDMRMPRVSGYEVLERLSRMSFLSRPRVLVLTAGSPELRAFDTSLVVGSVQKPFDIELLLDIVHGYVAGDVAVPISTQTSGPLPASEDARPN